MSFTYSQIPSPSGSGPFNFNVPYSDPDEIAVMGYNGKQWDLLPVDVISEQTVTLKEPVDGLIALRVSNNSAKVKAPITNGNDGNILTETSNLEDSLKILLLDPTDPTGSSPMTPESITIAGLRAELERTLRKRYGFADYNNSGSDIPLVANTWTDLPNDGAGPFTNLKLPEGVTSVMDTSTGYIDPTQLSIGDDIFIRNDFVVTPNTNDAKLEMRYVLGSGASEYVLEGMEPRLDSGSGVDYRKGRSVDYIYMGDENTLGNPIKLQIKLSSKGRVRNAGSVI